MWLSYEKILSSVLLKYPVSRNSGARIGHSWPFGAVVCTSYKAKYMSQLLQHEPLSHKQHQDSETREQPSVLFDVSKFAFAFAFAFAFSLVPSSAAATAAVVVVPPWCRLIASNIYIYIYIYIYTFRGS